ncbi:MAG: hypothetical protein EA401_10505 [Planctomycetota bacterium]|nr:MAG: hypothetical protein EA401_10505 [Planctomycetota bacterium]
MSQRIPFGHAAWALLLPLLSLGLRPPLEGVEFSAAAEVGPLWMSRNVVRYPGNSGDRIDLRQLTGSGPSTAARLHLHADLSPRHHLRFTAAPLSLSGSGTLNQARRFGDSTFDTSSPVRARYRFDTYRLSYRWNAYHTESWQLGIGAAVLLRDAEIRLRQGSQSERTSNVGVVPLLHLRATYQINQDWQFFTEVEGAAAEQGRAIDATAQILHAPVDAPWSLALGLRSLEGGADNNEVYAFAWYTSAIATFAWQW